MKAAAPCMSRRLSAGGSKVIFVRFPVRLAPTDGSLDRGQGTTRPYLRQRMQLPNYHNMFWRFVNGERRFFSTLLRLLACRPFIDLRKF